MSKIKETRREAQRVNGKLLKGAGAPWQLQTAKARFSEVFRLARAIGPQLITRHGREAVVVLSLEHFNQLVAREPRPSSLVEFFAESPLAGLQLNLERSKDAGRQIDP
jgi:antitoxin Phd